MERPEAAHWDVAAYALGVLDPREVPRFEQHLAHCPSCAAELERLVPATAVLADVDPAELREVEDLRLAGRLLEAVRGQRRRTRNRQRLTVAAGTAVAAATAGLALFAGASWFSTATGPPGAAEPTSADPTPAATPIGIGGPELGSGERFSATDPASGVHADVLLDEMDWGTQVSFALSSLTGPRDCQLVVVHVDGSGHPAASWRVPADGYGTEAHPAPLLLQSATAVPRTEIDHVQVLALEPDGTTTTLVTVTP
ncbi:MAG: hypothetical protein GEV12_02230 [Micromonosporaceae bacterium]|nr:hypothetical protein [Micromonosporaceae bacterium]